MDGWMDGWNVTTPNGYEVTGLLKRSKPMMAESPFKVQRLEQGGPRYRSVWGNGERGEGQVANYFVGHANEQARTGKELF
jgi:hypothetical protein